MKRSVVRHRSLHVCLHGLAYAKKRWPHYTGAILGMFLLSACARPLAPLPREPLAPDENPRPSPTPTAGARVPLNEEPIELEPVPAPTAPAEAEPQSGTPSALPPLASAPSPVSAIGASAAPRTVAATRLAEEARVRMISGDVDGALEQLERAIAVDPQNGYAYYFLAEAHFRRAAYDQAILFADRAAALLSARDKPWTSRSYALAGRVYEAAGRFADARAAYRRAFEVDPTNNEARDGLARVGGTTGAP